MILKIISKLQRMSKNKTQALVICGHGSSLNLYKKDFEIAKRKFKKKFGLTVMIVS